MADQRQQQHQKQISVKDERMKKLQYEKRKSTLLKGAKELSILCGINVCVVVLSPDGKLETWPENLDDVRAAFRDAAHSNKRPRSDSYRKPPAHPNPSQVEIVLDDEDGKKANKKMKAAISDDYHATGNSVAGEGGGGGTTVLVMGEKTEDHHNQYQPLSLYNSCGNYYYHQEGFPAFGEWDDNFAAGIGNYENSISCSSYGGYSGGGYSSSSGYEIQNLHEWNYSDDYTSGAPILFDPLLCVQPLQSRFRGDFQFGNHYI